MKINVSKIKTISGKTMDVELTETIPELSMDEENIKLLSPLKFSGKIENLGDRLMVSGEISTTVKLLCSRCAEAMAYALNAPFSEFFTNHKKVMDDDQEEEISLFSGDEIDITLHLARAILLELPMKAICQEECQGLCPGCGVNLNQTECQCSGEEIDPRLMALKKLIKPRSTEGGVSSGSTTKKNI